MSQNRLSSNHFSNSRSDQNLVGSVLVSSPKAGSRAGFGFNRCVVLVLQDNQEGVFGVVVNQPASSEMMMAWQKFAGPSFSAEKIVAGGPVVGPVLALHRRPDIAEMEVHGGLFVSAQKEALEQLSEMELHQDPYDDDETAFRIVMGAVSWKTAQLQHEIDSGLWFVTSGNADQIFSDSENMWENLLRNHGRKSIMELTGIRSFPASPLLN